MKRTTMARVTDLCVLVLALLSLVFVFKQGLRESGRVNATL